jgi:hypothetical protein
MFSWRFKIRAQHVFGWFSLGVCGHHVLVLGVACPSRTPCTHRRALVGRGRIGLAVAWSCFGHSGRSTCCQPRGAAAARACIERPPLAPLPSPVLAWPPRLDTALPSGHTTLSHCHVPPGRRLTEPSPPFRPWPFFPVTVADGPLR